jgi:hypothetical protein
MPLVDTTEMISVTDASKAGVSALVKAAEEGGRPVLMRNNKAVAAVISIDNLHATEEAEDRILDLCLGLTRSLTANERRHSLDDVLDHFGVTREELEKED